MGVVASEENKAIWFLQIDSSKYFLPENKKLALKHFANIVLKNATPFFRKIIERYDENDGYLWNLFDVDIAPTFYKNNIVLIGDAAHPLLSFTSQGVNSALEDIDLLIDLINESKGDFNHLDLDKFSQERIKVNTNYIIEGRALMDRFLFPQKYDNDIVPFIQA
jgi:2-polyprenyl-6-methoxyphenol hydroxylase-like FAD-dependent oxidoreductase